MRSLNKLVSRLPKCPNCKTNTYIITIKKGEGITHNGYTDKCLKCGHEDKYILKKMMVKYE